MMTNRMPIEDIQVDGYLGNQHIKKTGTAFGWTPEMIEEYIKCSKDPIYFIRTYIRIISLDEGLVPFQLFDYQKRMVESFFKNRNTVITTARQVGKSTTTVAFLLWYVLFHGEKTVALLANKGETAREILGKVQIAYENLPKWLQQGVLNWNKGSIELENKSRIIASSTSATSIRGYSINILFIDEAAHIDNWEEFFTSVYPTIASGKSTKVILVSTPNGLNHFYKLWIGAKEKKNNYNPIQVMWYDDPRRDEAWKKEILAGMNNDVETFAQEQECEFLGSSGTLISGAKLKQLVYRDPIVEKDGICMYEKPIEKHSYVLIADVSHGKGLDYSAFHIIDVTKMPYRQVCVFRDNMTTPIDYSSTIQRFGLLYNEAQILVEINDIGALVASSIYEEYEYENLLSTTNHGGRSGKQIVPGFDSKSEKGIRTTKTVKTVGCSVLKLLVEQDQLLLNDFNTISELSTFSKKGNSYEAEPGCHDDLAMGLVLFGWLSNQRYFKELTDINTLNQLRDKNDNDLYEQLAPFGQIVTGHEHYEEKPLLAVKKGDDRWLLGNDDDPIFEDNYPDRFYLA